MSTITWSVKKKTFLPEKNYFEYENVKVSREESKEESELYDKMMHYDSLAFTWAAILGIGGAFAALIGGSLMINFVSQTLGIFCALFFVAVTFSSIPVFRILSGKSDKYRAAWDKYREDLDVWNTSPSVLEVKAWNEEQERIAEAWRAEHPFEEQIRQCLLDPKSSVDIAKAAIIYVENYFDKES